MVEIKTIAAAETWGLRQRVMWPERPLEYVKIAGEDTAVHYGLYLNHQLVSVISLFFNGDTAQFRKFATDAARQRQGFGSKLLQYVIRQAADYGCRYLWCHARCEKAGFYRTFGLQQQDNAFERSGKKYVKMGMQLSAGI